MKLKSLIPAIPLVIVLNAEARMPQCGYRGFVEWSNDYHKEYGLISKINALYTGVSTSHGYQINSMFFVGAGLQFEHCRNVESWYIPAFLQGRADFKFGRFTPFADLRLGYNLSQGGGVYFSPSLGYRFNWGRKLGVNLGLGMSLLGYKTEYYNVIITPDGYQTLQYVGTKHHVSPCFSFRIGIDF